MTDITSKWATLSTGEKAWNITKCRETIHILQTVNVTKTQFVLKVKLNLSPASKLPNCEFLDLKTEKNFLVEQPSLASEYISDKVVVTSPNIGNYSRVYAMMNEMRFYSKEIAIMFNLRFASNATTYITDSHVVEHGENIFIQTTEMVNI